MRGGKRKGAGRPKGSTRVPGSVQVRVYARDREYLARRYMGMGVAQALACLIVDYELKTVTT